MRRLLLSIVLVSSPLWLGGCYYDDVGTTLHEPGEYKGTKDPLLAELKTQKMQDKLSERFKMSQTDR